MSFAPCVLIPVYNNPKTIENVVRGVREFLDEVIVIDDGSTDATRDVLDRLAAEGAIHLVRRGENGGKGAALRAGLAKAASTGFTHALQIDGDGQHDVQSIPAFLEAARAHPEALVLGYPLYDESVPVARAYGRKITNFWVHVETGGKVIRDAMTGCRVYPIAAALTCGARGDRMEIDIEIAVRMTWAGAPVVNLPVGVCYPTAEEGGVSHFRMVRDNVRISLMHTRLVCGAGVRRLRGKLLQPGTHPSPGGVAAGARGSGAAWLEIAEKGSLLGIRFVFFIATLIGRVPAQLVLHLPVAYFFAIHGSVRRASADYLRRILGRPPRWREVYAHIHRFAVVTLDRVFLLQGRDDLFSVSYSGHEHLVRTRESGRGAVLLSAHLGSAAAMNLDDRARRLRIHIVGYFRNARMINSILETINPEANQRVIHLDEANIGSIFAIRKRIAEGEMIAMTADRAGINERTADVEFLGALASFPTAPFLLASLLHCPVLLTFALYHPPNRYDLFCEPFADAIDLPRDDRDRELARLVQRYAARIEHYCRLAPYSWANFYDFWREPSSRPR